MYSTQTWRKHLTFSSSLSLSVFSCAGVGMDSEVWTPREGEGESQHILGEKSEPLHCSLETVKNWKTEKISTKNKETAATVEILLCVRLPITRYNILVLTLMSTISDIKLITCLWALTCCIVGLLGAVTLWAADGQGRWFSCEVIWTEEC